MARFSERIGLVKPREVLQLNGMDDPLRVAIWNLIHGQVTRNANAVHESVNDLFMQLVPLLATEVLGRPRDEVPYDCEDFWKQQVMRKPWNIVYEILEWVTLRLRIDSRLVNQVLEDGGSGYRLLAGELAPISNPQEVAAIEEAIESAGRRGLRGAAQNLSAAVAKLSEKPKPDYRNSIKESISAVESVVKVVSGKRAAGIKEPLIALQEVLDLHGGFAAGIKSLYGWTSDADGIRHAILDEPTVGYADAKFMLVTCSAFVNFVIEKAAALGELPR